jgi:hypothetical protein
MLSLFNYAQVICLILLFGSVILHWRDPQECSVADLWYLSGAWSYAGCEFFATWQDVAEGKIPEAVGDAFMVALFTTLAIVFLKIHSRGNWKNGLRKLRKAGGAKAKALKAKLVRKLRDSIKLGQPGLKPVPIPA